MSTFMISVPDESAEDFLKKLKAIKGIKVKPLTELDWVTPTTRKATNAEIEKRISSAMRTKSYTPREAKVYGEKLIKKWHKQRL